MIHGLCEVRVSLSMQFVMLRCLINRFSVSSIIFISEWILALRLGILVNKWCYAHDGLQYVGEIWHSRLCLALHMGMLQAFDFLILMFEWKLCVWLANDGNISAVLSCDLLLQCYNYSCERWDKRRTVQESKAVFRVLFVNEICVVSLFTFNDNKYSIELDWCFSVNHAILLNWKWFVMILNPAKAAKQNLCIHRIHAKDMVTQQTWSTI